MFDWVKYWYEEWKEYIKQTFTTPYQPKNKVKKRAPAPVHAHVTGTCQH